MNERHAVLQGTFRAPEIALYFARSDRHPRTGMPLIDWVKRAPGRRWDPIAGCWVLNGFGGTLEEPRIPENVLRSGGFTLDMSPQGLDPSLREILSLTDLFDPIVASFPDRPGVALVRHRFAGWELCRDILGPGATWDKARQRFEVPLTDILRHGDPKPGLLVEAATVEAARTILLGEGLRLSEDAETDSRLQEAAAAAAASTGIDLTHIEDAQVDQLVELVGDVPEDFGLALYPYQRIGAIAACAGRTLIADDTGIGKGSPASTRILTPHGWTTYGQIGVGDEVIGSDGRATTVLGVYPRGVLDVFRVGFSDGSSVLVDGDHLWAVETSHYRCRGSRHRVVSTRSLRAELSRGATINFIPLVEPVHFASAGDAHPVAQGEAHALGERCRREATPVPQHCLLATPEQRLELLRGIVGAQGRASGTFSSVSPELIEDVRFLVQSLGGTVSTVAARLGSAHSARPTSWAQKLQIVLPALDPDGSVRALTPNRSIETIEPAGRDSVICISVAADDALYVTEEFIVTHNTRTALAALALRKSQRAVLVVPPVVLTNWARETEQTGLAAVPVRTKKPKAASSRTKRKTATAFGQETSAGPVLLDSQAPPRQSDSSPEPAGDLGSSYPQAEIVMFRTGRKEPALPERGIVIVSDSLLTSRPETVTRLVDWQPDVLVYDEAHRARNWKSSRASVMRGLSDRLPASSVRLAMSATPLFANPQELASLLAITGHLGPIFGGFETFTSTYCKRNRFNAWVARPEMMPELRRKLNESVWVRRRKKDVHNDLPAVAIGEKYVDVDMKGFRAAHVAVIDKITEWLDEVFAETGTLPEEQQVETWSRSQIGLMSPLRKAAGLSKVPVVLDMISAWLDNEVTVNTDGTFVCDRPLLVWAHHHEVIDALVEHVDSHLKAGAQSMVATISGHSSDLEIGRTVDAFQAGRLPVLIGSITKAGVGITLTKGCDQTFLETDYSPPLVTQAIDRQNRIGQTRPVTVTFLTAPETLDPRIQEILGVKSDLIDQVLGSGSGLSIDETLHPGQGQKQDALSPSKLVEELVGIAIDNWTDPATRTPLAA